MATTSLISKITSLYLYGTLTPPTNKVTDGLIRPDLNADSYASTLSVDTADFMINGAGKYATPYEFEVVQKFFDTGNVIAQGSYSLTSILSKLGLSANTLQINLDQKEFGAAKTDYIERVYVFNNTKFSIPDSANLKFVVDANGVRTIENLGIKPEDDNFDFSGADSLTGSLNNSILPFIDSSDMLKTTQVASGLGRKVLIDFNDAVAKRLVYTASEFATDQTFQLINHGPVSAVLLLGTSFASALNDFWDAGITKFLDEQNRPILYGTNGSDKLSTADVSKIYSNGSAITGIGVNFIEDLGTYKANGVVLIGGKGNDNLVGYGKNDLLIGGAGADKFNVVGKETIKDATPEDRVFINGLEVTGGFKPLGFDVPIAMNETRGHLFKVLSGDITQPTGATLAVKYLWDNDAIATIKDYTRPYLGVGDGNIEIYEYQHGTPTSLSDLIKAYNAAYNNTANTTSTPGGNAAPAPSGADTNSANGSAEIYKPTVGTIQLRATIDGVFDTLSGAGALTKWQQFLPTLVGMKDYVLGIFAMHKTHDSYSLISAY